jgi:hypothetical protein
MKQINPSRRTRTDNHDSRQNGSALVMAVFVLAIVTMTGVSLLFLGSTELKMSQRSVDLKQTFYLAEAGEEAARTVLYLMNGNDDFSDELVSFAGDNGVFDLDVDDLSAILDSAGNLTGVSGVGDDVPIRPATSLGDGWYTAFVTNDPAEGITTTTDTNDLVMITSIGVTRNGSTEIVQAIVQRWELVPDLPPATITLLGQEVEFEGGSSSSHSYTGDDCPGGIPGLSVPVVGVISEAAETDAEQGIHQGDWDPVLDDYEGPEYESATMTREDTFVNLNDPDDPILLANDFGGLGEAWTDCEAMHEFVETMRDIADVVCCSEPVCSSTSECILPETRYTNVIFVDGDYEIIPPGGEGTLVVTGEARYDGKASWSGMIYAFGAGRFVQKGSGNGSISGAVMVANIAGPDGIYGNEDDCTGGDDDGFGKAKFDMSGGGTGDTQYCSADILAAKPNPPLRITNFRQD